MWTERLPVAFPAPLLAEANALAALIDPDTGGALTFSADRTQGGYIVASIPFKSHFWPIVERRDVTEWQAAMAEVAAAFGREPLPEATIATLCASLRINDEVPPEELPA